MNVLGISCYYHDAAACLVRDGVVVAAAHEERFDRVKGSAALPVLAVNWCLQAGGIPVSDVDHVAFYEKPYLKLERLLLSHLRAWPRSLATFRRTLPPWLEDRLIVPLVLKRDLACDAGTSFVRHHHAHAASAFFPSPFDEAAILTVDGVGEWTTTTLGRGRGNQVVLEHELRFPDSLGLIYTAVTTWLGFEALQGEGKVMALADFGEPRFLGQFHEMVHVRDDGSFRVDPQAFGFVEGDRMYGPGFVARFGPPRAPGAEITDLHRDVAASLQRFLEEVLVRMARHLHARTGLDALCMAGGVALNISATSRIMEETPFRDIFIQPAAGDAGSALGAALAVYHAITGAPRAWRMTTADLGPAYPDRAMQRALAGRGVEARVLSQADLLDAVASRVAAGRIVGWFQGSMEYGPRALGHRSILADPRVPDMKDVLNARVKHREPFRPYGVSILREHVGEWFHFDRSSPFMLQVARVREEVAGRIPAAIHVNGTSRLQTVSAEEDPLYHALLRRFHALTGVPMVINTSFNDNAEPIVCAPDDAVACYLRTDLDALAMGPFLAEKAPA